MSTEENQSADEKITKRAGVVASGTLLSRILGAIRDAAIAAVFLIKDTDAFWLAFTIPNTLRMLFGEGAASAAFVPILSEAENDGGPALTRHVFRGLLGRLILILSVIVAIGIAFAPWIVMAYAWGYQRDPVLFAQTTTLAQWVFPYIFLMGVASLMTATLHAHKRFIAASFAPALLNVAFIAGALLLAPKLQDFGLASIMALAIAALVGGTAHLLALIAPLRSIGFELKPIFRNHDAYVKKAFRLLTPLLAGMGIYQVNILLSRLFASFLPEGSVSFLYYGQRLVEIPQGMFALAVASATLPSLADAVNRGNAEESRRLFHMALRLILFVAIPATLALTFLAEPTVTVFFGRGRFDAHSIAETTRSLVWLALGIWAVACVRTTIPMFHAHNDTRSPVIASGVNLVTFVILSLVLMPSMQHAGLALAISAAAFAQLFTLMILLKRKVGELQLQQLIPSLLKMSLAALIMTLVVVVIRNFGEWSAGGNSLINISVLVACVLGGALSYLLSARLLKLQEAQSILGIFRRRST